MSKVRTHHRLNIIITLQQVQGKASEIAIGIVSQPAQEAKDLEVCTRGLSLTFAGGNSCEFNSSLLFIY